MTNFQRIVVWKFLSSLYFAVPIATIFLMGKGLTFSQVMLLESAMLLADLLFEIPAGIIGDKIGRKWSIVFGQLIMLLAWIPWFFADSFLLFALSFFIGGIGLAFQSGSDQALIYDDLKEQGKESLMQKSMGRYFAAMTLGVAIASCIGGFLAASRTADAFYVLYSLTAFMQFVGLLVLFTVREPKIQTDDAVYMQHEHEGALRHFVGGLHHLWSHRKLRRIFLLSLFTLPFSYVLIYIFQPYFLVAGVDVRWYGIAVALASVATVCTKLMAHKMEAWFGVDRGTLIATMLPGCMWILLALVFHPILSVAMYIATDALGNMRDPIMADYANRHIPSHMRATVLSIMYVAASLYSMIMRPIAGLLADIDLRYAFIAMGTVIIFGALFFRVREADVALSERKGAK